MLNITKLLEKYNSKPQWYITSRRSEWPSSKKSANSKQRGCGGKGILNCWWNVIDASCTVWTFLRKLKIELPDDPAIPFLGIYLEKTIFQTIHTPQCSLQQYLHSPRPESSVNVLPSLFERTEILCFLQSREAILFCSPELRLLSQPQAHFFPSRYPQIGTSPQDSFHPLKVSCLEQLLKNFKSLYKIIIHWITRITSIH